MICKICGPFYDGVGRNLQCHGLAGSVIPGNGDQVMSAPSFMQITPVTTELGYWDTGTKYCEAQARVRQGSAKDGP